MKKPGSSLLLTILIVAAVSTVLITVTQSTVESGRALSGSDASSIAVAQAQQGIQEGLVRYSTYVNSAIPNSLTEGGLFQGEYGKGVDQDILGGLPGSTSQPYSLIPMRRGFRVGTKCTEVWSDSSIDSLAQIDPACPYYDLAVRTVKAISVGGTLNVNSVDIPVAGLKLQIKDLVSINPAVTIAPQPTSIQVNTCELYEDYLQTLALKLNSNPPSSPACSIGSTGTATINPGASVYVGGNPSSSKLLSSYGKNVYLLLTFTAQPTSVIFTAGTAGTGDTHFTAIERGYTVIQAIGYSGTVQKKLLLTIHPAGTTPNNIIDSTETYTAQGLCALNLPLNDPYAGTC